MIVQSQYLIVLHMIKRLGGHGKREWASWLGVVSLSIFRCLVTLSNIFNACPDVRDAWLLLQRFAQIISPPEESRKDPETRRQYLRDADAAILCLPDAASQEAAVWADEDDNGTVLIDASTAFRVDPGR